MNGHRKIQLTVASVCFAFCLGVAWPAQGASLTMVPRSTWGASGVPSYMQMYIYVPDKLATNPPIYVSSHSCGSTATGQLGNIPISKAAADSNGFIMILPDNPGQNCWDVGTTASLSHNGGGDTEGVAQMVKYALTKYNGDPTRVYAMGGSGGGMMTQALMAVYPDVFRAGAARAGVPAGCWASGYSSSNQWSNNCANGDVTMTAQAWGNLVRAMDPGYTGHRPRLQTYQGTADTTISYNNTGESIKEWTNVLDLSTTPTSTDTGYKTPNATYNRQFWSNACGYTVFQAWSSPGGTHSMPYEEAEILKFFGLDKAGGTDPEPDCSGAGGAGGGAGGGGGGRAGTGGAVGTGGSAGNAGTGGTVGTGGSTTGTGGAVGSGGSTGSGGTGARGGDTGSGGVVGTGGSLGSGGSSAEGGTGGASTGGEQGSGGFVGSAGSSGSGSGGTGPTQDGTSSSGCACAVGSQMGRSVSILTPLLLATLGLVIRRRQGRPRRPSR